MLEFLETEDGSHTLRSARFDATYHSTHGSFQETRRVFIEAGLYYFTEKGYQEISILEIGFGTGLNAFMSYLEAKKLNISLHYDSYELYPIGPEQASKLNYPELLNAAEEKDFFLDMHRHENITLNKRISDENHIEFQLLIDNFELQHFSPKYHLIYFDAFAPSVQPQLWQEPFLRKMYDALSAGGILVTYCAQGAFKRALKAVGFQIEALPGPKGKREMTRAFKY